MIKDIKRAIQKWQPIIERNGIKNKKIVDVYAIYLEKISQTSIDLTIESRRIREKIEENSKYAEVKKHINLITGETQEFIINADEEEIGFKTYINTITGNIEYHSDDFNKIIKNIFGDEFYEYLYEIEYLKEINE